MLSQVLDLPLDLSTWHNFGLRKLCWDRLLTVMQELLDLLSPGLGNSSVMIQSSASQAKRRHVHGREI